MFLLLWVVKGLSVASRPLPDDMAPDPSPTPARVPVAAGVGARGSSGQPVTSEPPDSRSARSPLRQRVRRTRQRGRARLAALVQPGPLNRFFRHAQTVSAAAMAVGHGMQDAAKTMGIVVLALYTGGFQDSKTHIPEWVYYTSATVLALGTYAGGWRIIRTLGRRIIHLRPPEGFAAESVASSVLYFNALVLGAPISTTHTITSAIMGVGATKKVSAVRWGVAGNIVTAWVLTFPCSAAIAVVVYFLVRPLF
jgi:phosphate/sulfate permease